MGVTIHYTIAYENKDALIRVLKAVAKVYSKYLIQELVCDERRGIIEVAFQVHPKAETLTFRFYNWKKWKNSDEWAIECLREWVRKNYTNKYNVFWDEWAELWICKDFCKTQFAGTQAHVIVAEIIRKVAMFASFAYIVDEGEYYETLNTDKVDEYIAQIDAMINTLANAFKRMGFNVKTGDEL